MHTAEALWTLAWPDVPFQEASEPDKQMYRDHADSLNRWEATR